MEKILDMDVFFRNAVFGDRRIVAKRLVLNAGARLAGMEYKWLNDTTFDVSLFSLNSRLGKRIEELEDVTFNFSGSLVIVKEPVAITTSTNDGEAVQRRGRRIEDARSIKESSLEQLDDEVWRFGFWMKLG